MKINRIAKICFVGGILVSIFLASRNKLKDLLFFEITKKESIRNFDLGAYYATFKPFRNWEVEEPEIKADSAISVAIGPKGENKVLFQKNSKKILPIASVTKLMTALIIFENYDLSQKIVISENIANTEGDINNFKAGEAFYTKDLLYPLLMESSNASGKALSEIMGEENFVDLMNKRAKELGLLNTHFLNSTGLDPDNAKTLPNLSSAKDLVTLSSFLLGKSVIWEILKTKEFELYQVNGSFHHKVKNTNEFLELPVQNGWETKILGGKTGKTPLAKECFLLVLEGPRSNFLVNVILGSQNRFEEMKTLINWINIAYKW